MRIAYGVTCFVFGIVAAAFVPHWWQWLTLDVLMATAVALAPWDKAGADS